MGERESREEKLEVKVALYRVRVKGFGGYERIWKRKGRRMKILI